MSSASRDEITGIFESAAKIDPDVRLPAGDLGALTRRRMRPTNWRRAHLFRNMWLGGPSLYHDFPMPLFRKGSCRSERLERLLEAVSQAKPDRPQKDDDVHAARRHTQPSLSSHCSVHSGLSPKDRT